MMVGCQNRWFKNGGPKLGGVRGMEGIQVLARNLTVRRSRHRSIILNSE